MTQPIVSITWSGLPPPFWNSGQRRSTHREFPGAAAWRIELRLFHAADGLNREVPAMPP